MVCLFFRPKFQAKYGLEKKIPRVRPKIPRCSQHAAPASAQALTRAGSSAAAFGASRATSMRSATATARRVGCLCGSARNVVESETVGISGRRLVNLWENMEIFLENSGISWENIGIYGKTIVDFMGTSLDFAMEN